MSTKPFLQAVEVWIPDGERLRRQSGAYVEHASEVGTYARGEALPGTVWAEQRPIIEHASAAFPMLRDGNVVAVVALRCDADAGGCIELWQPNDLRELALSAGYYGQLRPFEELSRLLRFQRGRGLPGIVWERGLPHVMPDLKAAGAFIRAAAARTAGVDAGLGVPLFRDGELAQVLLLLSAHATPLARAFELWRVEPGPTLRLSEFYYASELGLGETPGTRPAQPPGEGLALRVLATMLPVASQAPHTLTPSRGAAPSRLSFTLGLGLPVHDGTELRAVVTLLS
ncbi:MAG: hypothetical protein ABW352_02795 [Polyangiales bacterium]